MSDNNQTPDTFGGIKVRKLRDGTRTWEIEVAAAGSSPEQMQEAADEAIALDEQLCQKFDPKPEVYRLGDASADIEPAEVE